MKRDAKALAQFLGCEPGDIVPLIRDAGDRGRPFYKNQREFLEWRAVETESEYERALLQDRYARCFAPGALVPELPAFKKKGDGRANFVLPEAAE
jgi:hypothetical protein